MEIVSLNIGLGSVENKILEALEQGNVVACPTDTVYGLLADISHPEAIQKIFSIKQRQASKPLGVFVKDIAMAKRYARVSDSQEKFLKSFWPGAVTAILKSKGNLPKELRIKETIGMRVPDSRLLQDILARLDRPLVQTSANISGTLPLRSAQMIQETFSKQQEKPDLLIDGGELVANSSRVIDLTRENHDILRK